MAALTTGLMTSEQFLALPEKHDRHGNRIKRELIAGVIVEEGVSVSSASARHDLIKNQIGGGLMAFLAAHTALDLKALIEIAFEVTGEDDLQPDVCVIKKSRLRELETRVLTGAPEIAIEVMSPNDKAIELKHKIHTYLANGSESVWVAYPEDRSIEVYTKTGIRELTGDQPLEDPALPGFSQPVSGFFENL